MNILLLGSGAREHAFAVEIVSSEKCTQLYVLPGNAGTAELPRTANLAGSVTDFEYLKKLCHEYSIGMVVVGPEEPLVLGIHDYFVEEEELSSVVVIGPHKNGARLEGSKEFAKRFMARHMIPTAAYANFKPHQLEMALDYLDMHTLPIVLKADGLAAGKGVFICHEREEAKEILTNMLSGRSFGDAGKTVIVEEYLEGKELSVFVLCDGKSYKILPVARDYKRIGEGDTGLNTGGMGSISPVEYADKDFIALVNRKIILPTLEGLKEDHILYSGFLFFGLIKVGGNPFVIEYNVRMGDPETESVLRRLKTPFLDLLIATGDARLDDIRLEVKNETAVSVVLVSKGYPGTYETGKEIFLPQPRTMPLSTVIYHAGTLRKTLATGLPAKLETAGGRVLVCSSLASTAEEACQNATAAAMAIQFEGKQFRKDIGRDSVGVLTINGATRNK